MQVENVPPVAKKPRLKKKSDVEAEAAAPSEPEPVAPEPTAR